MKYWKVDWKIWRFLHFWLLQASGKIEGIFGTYLGATWQRINLGANKQTIRYFFPFFRISDRILRAEKWREVQKSITPMLDLETVRLVSEISEHHLVLLLVSEIMSLEQLVILFQILPILYIGITKFFLSSATLRNMFSNFW